MNSLALFLESRSQRPGLSEEQMKKSWKHRTCARCSRRVNGKTSVLCRICLWLVEIRKDNES